MHATVQMANTAFSIVLGMASLFAYGHFPRNLSEHGFPLQHGRSDDPESDPHSLPGSIHLGFGAVCVVGVVGSDGGAD